MGDPCDARNALYLCQCPGSETVLQFYKILLWGETESIMQEIPLCYPLR